VVISTTSFLNNSTRWYGGAAIYFITGCDREINECTFFAGQLGSSCNVSVDPQYCSVLPENELNRTLQSNSPCWAENNPNGSTIGAWPSGCEDTPTQRVSWGTLEARHRGEAQTD